MSRSLLGLVKIGEGLSLGLGLQLFDLLEFVVFRTRTPALLLYYEPEF